MRRNQMKFYPKTFATTVSHMSKCNATRWNYIRYCIAHVWTQR